MDSYKIRLSGGTTLFLSVSKSKTTYSVIGRFRQKQYRIPLRRTYSEARQSNACFCRPLHTIYDTTQSGFCQLQASYFFPKRNRNQGLCHGSGILL